MRLATPGSTKGTGYIVAKIPFFVNTNTVYHKREALASLFF